MMIIPKIAPPAYCWTDKAAAPGTYPSDSDSSGASNVCAREDACVACSLISRVWPYNHGGVLCIPAGLSKISPNHNQKIFSSKIPSTLFILLVHSVERQTYRHNHLADSVRIDQEN